LQVRDLGIPGRGQSPGTDQSPGTGRLPGITSLHKKIHYSNCTPINSIGVQVFTHEEQFRITCHHLVYNRILEDNEKMGHLAHWKWAEQLM
jgi:hypothetical protein